MIKDKAFFFGAYEGQRYNVGNSFGGITSPSMVPMPTPNGTCAFGFAGDCADSIPDAIADLQSAGVSRSAAASLNIAGCTLSGGTVTCNGTGFPTNNTQGISIANGFNNNVHVDNLVGKVDYRLNDRNSISGMYFFGNNSGTVEDFPELQQKWLSEHSHARAGGGRQLDLDSRCALGERSTRWLQPAVSADAARRSQHAGVGVRSEHGRKRSLTPAACRASALADTFFPAWVVSSGRSSRDRTRSRSSSITSPTPRVSTP